MWVLLFSLACLAEFGLVYIIASFLVFMYCNTGTSSREKGQLSAYSVFNEGNRKLLGEMDARQVGDENYSDRLIHIMYPSECYFTHVYTIGR